MSRIDPTARVEDGAVIGEGTSIGPYCVVGPDVVIGPNCKLTGHVNVVGHTRIGADCAIYPFAALGGPPQDLSYRGEPTRLEIGEGCIIREGVTMNIGTKKGGGITRVGARGYFMNNSHVGHDCIVGTDVIFATSATLGGHCDIGDFVYIGGLSAVHQFTRIGPQVMVGGVCGVRGDVIPFGLVNGQYASLEGLNIIGMKRRKFTRERLVMVRSFYQKLFHGSGIFADRLSALQPLAAEDPAIAEILAFLCDGNHRALCLPAEGGNAQPNQDLTEP
jgi:UDP-N-acetylglucosamine acyltransferase